MITYIYINYSHYLRQCVLSMSCKLIYTNFSIEYTWYSCPCRFGLTILQYNKIVAWLILRLTCVINNVTKMSLQNHGFLPILVPI
jgi:hypothetical protein